MAEIETTGLKELLKNVGEWTGDIMEKIKTQDGDDLLEAIDIAQHMLITLALLAGEGFGMSRQEMKKDLLRSLEEQLDHWIGKLDKHFPITPGGLIMEPFLDYKVSPKLKWKK
jgi:hypothetical protein